MTRWVTSVRTGCVPRRPGSKVQERTVAAAEPTKPAWLACRIRMLDGSTRPLASTTYATITTPFIRASRGGAETLVQLLTAGLVVSSAAGIGAGRPPEAAPSESSTAASSLK